jgi:hypothetical protein
VLDETRDIARTGLKAILQATCRYDDVITTMKRRRDRLPPADQSIVDHCITFLEEEWGRAVAAIEPYDQCRTHQPKPSPQYEGGHHLILRRR